MIVLVIGKPDSGKSKRAEELAMTLAGENKKLYLATMIPYGEEGAKRVEKHRKMRDGKGFVTIECQTDLEELSTHKEIGENVTCLLECVSNLAGNEMYKDAQKYWSIDQLKDKITHDIISLSEKIENMVIVTNKFELEESFDEDTIRYVELVNNVNEALKGYADRIYDITGEEWQIYENN